MDLSPALVAKNTGPNTLGFPGCGLVRQCGVGHQRASHADQVTEAILKQHLSMRRIDHSTEGQHRDAASRAPQTLLQIHKWPRRISHVRHMVLEAWTEVALREANIIELLLLRKTFDYARRLVRIDAAGDAFIAGHFESKNEVLSAVR